MTTEHDPKPAGKPAAEAPEGERIAKVMARAGLCSRRDAEAWIAAGRVTVNGKKLASPAVNVGPNDLVRVDGKPLPEAEKTRLFRYHKPRGLVTTAKDPEGRPTVFDNLPEGLPRVISIGRLDLNSEGLLLLTNDGELARRLELPATGWVRRYRVRVNGRIDPANLTRLAQGIEIEGVRYGAIEAVLDRQQGDNAWLTMSLTEGKNREIRKVCAFFGWTVSRLIRLSYGPFQLGHLEKGQIEEVPGKVVRDQLGQPGAPQPLRPHLAHGGKARPPKKSEERRAPATGDTRDKRDVYHVADERRQRKEDRHQGQERSRHRDTHPPHPAAKTSRQDGRATASAAPRRPDQSAEALAASLRKALDRASRDERAEELQNRSARPQAAKKTGLKAQETGAARAPAGAKSQPTFGKRQETRNSGKTRSGKPEAEGSHQKRSSAKADSTRGERSGNRPDHRSGKHAHRQRRP